MMSVLDKATSAEHWMDHMVLHITEGESKSDGTETHPVLMVYELKWADDTLHLIVPVSEQKQHSFQAFSFICRQSS